MVKEYDIIIWGATGFTGKLICNYIASKNDINNIKWAIAGRNEDRLSEIARKHSIPYYIANSFDSESLDKLSANSQLIITTVGPYSIYGEKLIASCIKNNTHYLDLTGEPNFVKRISLKYKDAAESSKAIIMHSCGFESIPSDLGAYLTVKELDSDDAYLTYYLKTKGRISGGTWASFLNSISLGLSEAKSASNRESKKNTKKQKKIFYSQRFKKWAMIFPVIDKYLVMKSSRNMKEYGRGFSFNLYTLQKSLFSIILIILGIMSLTFLSKVKFIKNFLLSRIPSGTGPSEEQRKRHWFEVNIIGKSKSKEVHTTISGGDPGYEETAKFISETALCIIMQKNALLKNKGILTLVECTGDLMRARLENAGIEITISKQ